jgi:hypothetical protein
LMGWTDWSGGEWSDGLWCRCCWSSAGCCKHCEEIAYLMAPVR